MFPEETRKKLALMEGKGTQLKVYGFNQYQRNAFLALVRAFGVGDGTWMHIMSHIKLSLKNKTVPEMQAYP